MKYLLLIALLFVVIWYVRGGRESLEERAPRQRRAPGPPPPQDMVECPVCRVHLPRSDALAGPDGRLYCCTEHRLRGG